MQKDPHCSSSSHGWKINSRMNPFLWVRHHTQVYVRRSITEIKWHLALFFMFVKKHNIMWSILCYVFTQSQPGSHMEVCARTFRYHVQVHKLPYMSSKNNLKSISRNCGSSVICAAKFVDSHHHSSFGPVISFGANTKCHLILKHNWKHCSDLQTI